MKESSFICREVYILGAVRGNARYKRGTSVPTLDKLTELLEAVGPGQDYVLQPSASG